MAEPSPFLEPPGLRVTVDRVLFATVDDSPPDRPYCFVYSISIHNNTESAVTIKGRKWVVHNAEGDVTAVEGNGVVGEHPRIEPGEKFSYQSRHFLDTVTGQAEGSFLGLDESGRRILVRIPLFKMVVPN